jgi:hypothetical protein
MIKIKEKIIIEIKKLLKDREWIKYQEQSIINIVRPQLDELNEIIAFRDIVKKIYENPIRDYYYIHH